MYFVQKEEYFRLKLKELTKRFTKPELGFLIFYVYYYRFVLLLAQKKAPPRL